MPLRCSCLRAMSAGILLLGASAGFSQGYPSKPLRIVTSPPGGGVDFAARLLAPGLARALGQPVVVENRGGNAAEIVARAIPDGYTLLVNGTSFWIGPLMRKSAWDPIRDFAPISFMTTAPNVLVAHPSVPANSVKELIELARARPGTLNYSSSAIGAAAHLGGELFKSQTGTNIVHIPYKGQGAANAAVLSGEVQLTLATPSSVAPMIKAGKLKVFGITSAQPSALAPGVPTIAATVPGYQIGSATALLAPTGTGVIIINRLNQEIVRLLNQAEVKEKLLGAGVEVVASSPQAFAAEMKSEMARLGKVIKDAGLRED